MPETAILEAPAPTPAPAAAPAAPEQLDFKTFLRDSAKTTPDVLSDLFPAWAPPKIANHTPAAPTPAPVAPPSPVTPAPAAEPAAAVMLPVGTPDPTITAAAPVAEAPAADPAAPALNPNLAKNWRLEAADAKEQLVFSLRRQGVPLQEAFREVYGEDAPAAPAAAPAPISPEPTVDPVQVADQQVTSLAAKVAELEAQIDEVAESDPKTATKLLRQQSDLKIELMQAKQNRESTARDIQDRQVARVVETHRQLEDQSLSQMYEVYPTLTDKKSEQRAQFNLKVAELQKNPAFGENFRDKIPGWPLMVAQMVDAEKGWSRTTNPPPVAPVPAAAPAPVNTPANPLAPKIVAPTPTAAPVRATQAELLSASTNPGAATPVPDAKTFWRESADVTPDQLIALLKHAPVDPRLTRSQKNDPRRFE